MTECSRAISAVLLASHGQRHWLKEPHPPWNATDALAVAHYGGPSAGLDLWRMCRAVEMLRVACEASSVEWRPIETAPYNEPVLAWLFLPKNPIASAQVIGERCLVEPGSEIPDEGIGGRVAGCWWVNGRYYGPGHVLHWRPLPDDPIPAPQSTAQTVEAVPGALVGDEAPTGAVVATGEVL